MTKNKQEEPNLEIKEQRVTKNNGKRFEVDFKASFDSHIWTYRPTDSGGGQNARFTIESICDLLAFDTKARNLVLMELKSTLGTSVSFKSHEFCMNYEKAKEDLEDWIASLPLDTKKAKAEEIKMKRKEIKLLYKETNGAMIKYHQILDLKKVKEEFSIPAYIIFKFFKTTRTFAVPIDSFLEFWKETDKKSINEKDLLELVEKEKALAIPQAYIRKSQASMYDVKEMTK